jgi:molybdate transport system substrate-binding protein
MRYPIVSVLLLSFACAAAADEIRILSAASMRAVLKDVGPEFEHASGHRLLIDYDTMGRIDRRVAAGESPDFVIGSGASVAGLVERLRIEPASQVVLAKVGVGLAVPAGDAVPPMASAEDFRRALLDAKRVVYARPEGGGADGIHVAKVIHNLGLDEAVAAKTKFGAGGDVAEVIAAEGPGTLGLTQISEIVGKPYVRYAGPMPDSLQNYTVFAAGRPVGKESSAALRDFVSFLRTPRVVEAMKANGMKVD